MIICIGLFVQDFAIFSGGPEGGSFQDGFAEGLVVCVDEGISIVLKVEVSGFDLLDGAGLFEPLSADAITSFPEQGDVHVCGLSHLSFVSRYCCPSSVTIAPSIRGRQSMFWSMIMISVDPVDPFPYPS